MLFLTLIDNLLKACPIEGQCKSLPIHFFIEGCLEFNLEDGVEMVQVLRVLFISILYFLLESSFHFSVFSQSPGDNLVAFGDLFLSSVHVEFEVHHVRVPLEFHLLFVLLLDQPVLFPREQHCHEVFVLATV